MKDESMSTTVEILRHERPGDTAGSGEFVQPWATPEDVPDVAERAASDEPWHAPQDAGLWELDNEEGHTPTLVAADSASQAFGRVHNDQSMWRLTMLSSDSDVSLVATPATAEAGEMVPASALREAVCKLGSAIEAIDGDLEGVSGLQYVHNALADVERLLRTTPASAEAGGVVPASAVRELLDSVVRTADSFAPEGKEGATHSALHGVAEDIEALLATATEQPPAPFVALDEDDDTPPDQIIANVIRELRTMSTISEAVQGHVDRIMRAALCLQELATPAPASDALREAAELLKRALEADEEGRCLLRLSPSERLKLLLSCVHDARAALTKAEQG